MTSLYSHAQENADGWRELALSYEQEIKRMCETIYRLYSEGRISLCDCLEIFGGQEIVKQLQGEVSEEKFNDLLTGWTKDGKPVNPKQVIEEL